MKSRHSTVDIAGMVVGMMVILGRGVKEVRAE
jgi:hypothetical protein